MDSRPPAGKGAAYEMSYLVTGLDAASTSDVHNVAPPEGGLPSHKGYVYAGAAPAPAQGDQTFGPGQKGYAGSLRAA